MKRKFDKKFFILILITVVCISAIAFSYAYFASFVSDESKTKVVTKSDALENLTFTQGDEINIEYNLNNFIDGGGSLSGNTTSTAKLVAGTSADNSARNYNVYFNITANNFIYTQSDLTPELLLKVTDPTGNEITLLDALDYKTVSNTSNGEEVSGFDITTFEGLVDIALDYEISTSSEVTQDWNLEIIFVNLNANQIANEGSTFDSNLILMENKAGNFNDLILNNNGGIQYIVSKGDADTSTIATTNEGMYSALDDYGTSYYFRGAVDNNWVNFGGYYWRIIRINGDDNVRLIYSGEVPPIEAEKVVISDTDLSIGATYMNFWGYMTREDNYEMIYEEYRHSNILDSEVKKMNESWYSGTDAYSSLENSLINYAVYLADSYFCNDRTAAKNNNESTWDYEFAFADRYFSNEPSLMCSEIKDAFTVDDIINGNGALTYPIGMITGDEFIYAGNVPGVFNSNNFLYSNYSYVSMTPITQPNNLEFYYAGMTSTYWESRIMLNMARVYYYERLNNGLRPVINIKSESLFTGEGTWDDPYVLF